MTFISSRCAATVAFSAVSEGLTDDYDIANRFANHFHTGGGTDILSNDAQHITMTDKQYSCQHVLLNVEDVDMVVRCDLKLGKAELVLTISRLNISYMPIRQ